MGLGAESPSVEIEVGSGLKMVQGQPESDVGQTGAAGAREGWVGREGGHGEEGFMSRPWAGTAAAGVVQGAVSCHTGTGRF